MDADDFGLILVLMLKTLGFQYKICFALHLNSSLKFYHCRCTPALVGLYHTSKVS